MQRQTRAAEERRGAPGAPSRRGQPCKEWGVGGEGSPAPLWRHGWCWGRRAGLLGHLRSSLRSTGPGERRTIAPTDALPSHRVRAASRGLPGYTAAGEQPGGASLALRVACGIGAVWPVARSLVRTSAVSFLICRLRTSMAPIELLCSDRLRAARARLAWKCSWFTC